MDTVVNTGNISFTVAMIVAVMIPYCFATRSVDIVMIFMYVFVLLYFANLS